MFYNKRHSVSNPPQNNLPCFRHLSNRSCDFLKQLWKSSSASLQDLIKKKIGWCYCQVPPNKKAGWRKHYGVCSSASDTDLGTAQLLAPPPSQNDHQRWMFCINSGHGGSHNSVSETSTKENFQNWFRRWQEW